PRKPQQRSANRIVECSTWPLYGGNGHSIRGHSREPISDIQLRLHSASFSKTGASLISFQHILFWRSRRKVNPPGDQGNQPRLYRGETGNPPREVRRRGPDRFVRRADGRSPRLDWVSTTLDAVYHLRQLNGS